MITKGQALKLLADTLENNVAKVYSIDYDHHEILEHDVMGMKFVSTELFGERKAYIVLILDDGKEFFIDSLYRTKKEASIEHNLQIEHEKSMLEKSKIFV